MLFKLINSVNVVGIIVNDELQTVFLSFVFFSQETKNLFREKPADVEFSIVAIGDKSKAALQRFFGNQFILTGNEIGRQPPTFEDAAIAAQAILDSGVQFDQVVGFLRTLFF